MSTFTRIKDPDAVLDYAVDWSDWLADAETIDTIAVAVDEGDVEIEASPAASETDGVVTAWVSGGTDNTQAVVRYRVTTSDGRTDDRSIKLIIRER